METGRHGVWELNTSGSPLNTGVWETSRPLITVYDTVNPALTRSNFGFFPLDFLGIGLKTSLNTSPRDRPPRCFERQYARIAAQHRTIPHPSTPLITVYDTVNPALTHSNFGFFPLDFFNNYTIEFGLRHFRTSKKRFWLKTNSILLPHTSCWFTTTLKTNCEKPLDFTFSQRSNFLKIIN